MQEVETSAKTVDEAIQIALERLGVGREEVEVDVLSEGKPGILGLGSEEARVRVRLLRSSPPEPGQQGDVARRAQAVLETLLDKLGVTASVEPQPLASVTQGEETAGLVFDIRGDNLGILIGRRGQTLACLQYLLRLIVADKTKTFVPVVVDVNGYRQRRYQALQALAQRMAEQVKEKRMPFSLEPMTAFERRIIHLALAGHPEVTTQSVGVGESRKVVIVLKEQG